MAEPLSIPSIKLVEILEIRAAPETFKGVHAILKLSVNGFIINDVHVRAGKNGWWITFPSRMFKANNGTTRYFPLVEIGDAAFGKEVQQYVLDTVRETIGLPEAFTIPQKGPKVIKNGTQSSPNTEDETPF